MGGEGRGERIGERGRGVEEGRGGIGGSVVVVARLRGEGRKKERRRCIEGSERGEQGRGVRRKKRKRRENIKDWRKGYRVWEGEKGERGRERWQPITRMVCILKWYVVHFVWTQNKHVELYVNNPIVYLAPKLC